MQLALWTAGIVVLTLLVNAPLMPYLLKWTNLNNASPVKVCRCPTLLCTDPPATRLMREGQCTVARAHFQSSGIQYGFILAEQCKAC